MILEGIVECTTVWVDWSCRATRLSDMCADKFIYKLLQNLSIFRNVMTCKKHCWSNLNDILSHKLHLNTRKHHQQQCKLRNVINSSSIVTVYELLIEMSMGTTWMQTPFLAPHSERARQIKIKLLSFGGCQFHGAWFLPAEAVKCVLWSKSKEDSLVRTQMNRFSCAYLGTNSDCRKCARCCRIWFGWVWRP